VNQARRVLVVDDDEGIRSSLERSLRLAGFQVDLADDGGGAMSRVLDAPPDVVVLDVMLPDCDGVTIVRRLRQESADVPILMLSARSALGDRVAGLQAGADDYLVKPFAVEELVARLEALLRRQERTALGRVCAGDLVVEPARRDARRGGRPLHLSRREYDLLEVLARNQSVVLTRAQLLELVWGYDFPADGNVVDVFVGYLRRKLEAAGEPRLIHTVRGVGFVLRP
jgi:two-component system response regulator PrrA